jgi:hypothetical protein
MTRPLRLLGALLGALAAVPAPAAVESEPPAVTVAPGRAAEVVVKWVFSREPFDAVASRQGAFVAPFSLEPLLVVPVALEGKLTRGAGTLTEKLTVPAALVDAMRARRLAEVTYVRAFDRSEGAVLVRFDAGPSSKVTVERIELAFPGGAAEATVARRGPVPAAVASVRYQGAGLLEAAWEVDGKVHAKVARPVDVLGAARFEAPELPPLPAEVAGPHRLRFVPARAARSLEVPAVTYHVTADAPAAAPAPLALTAPAPEAALPFEEVRLAWSPGRSALFLVDLRDCDSGAALFSAHTRATEYRLPAFGVSPHLVPGTVVCWKVIGFDAEGLAVEASEVRRLRVTYPRGAP